MTKTEHQLDAAFRALCVEFDVLTEDEIALSDDELLAIEANYSGKEDAILALLNEDGYAVHRYVAVTDHTSDDGDEFVYLYCFPTLDGAKERAEEFIDDSLFDESPRCIVDLETGQRLTAKLVVEWKLTAI